MENVIFCLRFFNINSNKYDTNKMQSREKDFFLCD